MKRWISGLCVLSLFTLNLTAADSNWTLVWSDEFDAPGLPDETKWAYEEGFIRNKEQQYNHTRKTHKGDKIEIAQPYECFHVYAVEWHPDRIDYYVDNTQYFSFENEGTGNDAWPFDRDHYLILNIAVGGSWGGQQGIDDAIFPQKMQVDYVRVYQTK